MRAKKSQLHLYVILFAWGLFVLTGCRMANDDTGPSVYIAGIVYMGKTPVTPFPCFWKNGVKTDLSLPKFTIGGGLGYSIYVSGDDVYIAGWIKVYTGKPDLGYVSRPCFWKNGARTDLDLPRKTEDGGNGLASSIFISNGDVYIAGSYSETWNRVSSSSIPCIWKNGIRTDLATIDDPAQANSIFVSGNDVYVAGDEYLEEPEHTFFPCYWKNGVRTDLPSAKDAETIWESSAKSIFVSGNDVYAAGYIQTYSTALHLRNIPCYWKNGLRIDLSLKTPSIGEWGWATSVFVSGSDVYVAGNDYGQQISIPCYWKNGNRTELRVWDESHGGYASAIYVFADDVYVAGEVLAVYANYSIIHIPCYWKNEFRADLNLADENKGGSTNSIFFVPGK
jgi:hypothetical protein